MSAVLGATGVRTPWRQSLPMFGLVLAAVLLVFRETFSSMVEIWSRSETFAHAYLVPPIASWLVWRLRHRLAMLAPQPQPWLIVPMLVVGAAWLIGELATVNALTQFTATAILVLTVPAMLGLGVARVLSFPLAFLFFMVPIGDFLLPVLMEATANFTISAVQLSGVPVYREGLQFVIPTGSWSVVEACSGVRYLIASFMVGTLFAYLNYRSTRRRLVFAAVSIAVPIVANWLRAYMIVMLGHLSSNRIATGVDHLLYGWVFFGVVILLMFLIGARWSEPDAAPTGAQAEDRPAPAPATGPAARWIVAALVVAAAAWPQLAADRIEHQVRPGTPDLVLPANLPGGWAREPAAADGYRPVYVGPVTETGALYRSGERLVGVHIAYFRAQGPGRKLVSSDNVLVRSNNHDWNLVSQEAASIDVDGRAVGFRRAQVLGGGITRFTSLDRYEVRQLHWVAGRWVSSLQWAAAIGVLDRLAGHGDDAAGVVIHTARVEGRDASKDLDDFMRQHLARIEATLAAARTSP